jgi:hypothetical protein
MFVQGAIRELYKKKTTSIFIKLDILKAFYSVNWPYLLGIMAHLGFGKNWRNWISSLWCTTSSTILLNGEPGSRVLQVLGKGTPYLQCFSSWSWIL